MEYDRKITDANEMMERMKDDFAHKYNSPHQKKKQKERKEKKKEGVDELLNMF